MATEKVYRKLAQLVGAYHRCKSPDANESQREWADKHAQTIRDLCSRYMPHGSGLDADRSGKLDLANSSEEKLVFWADFHHMDEHGSYDGWTSHMVTVRPSLALGFRLSISGPNRNDIKGYIGQAFEIALNAEIGRCACNREAAGEHTFHCPANPGMS